MPKFLKKKTSLVPTSFPTKTVKKCKTKHPLSGSDKEDEKELAISDSSSSSSSTRDNIFDAELKAANVSVYERKPKISCMEFKIGEIHPIVTLKQLFNAKYPTLLAELNENIVFLPERYLYQVSNQFVEMVNSGEHPQIGLTLVNRKFVGKDMLLHEFEFIKV